jgi:hypothetical protein
MYDSCDTFLEQNQEKTSNSQMRWDIQNLGTRISYFVFLNFLPEYSCCITQVQKYQARRRKPRNTKHGNLNIHMLYADKRPNSWKTCATHIKHIMCKRACTPIQDKDQYLSNVKVSSNYFIETLLQSLSWPQHLWPVAIPAPVTTRKISFISFVSYYHFTSGNEAAQV